MERLTKRLYEEIVCVETGDLKKIYQKLAEYEDEEERREKGCEVCNGTMENPCDNCDNQDETPCDCDDAVKYYHLVNLKAFRYKLCPYCGRKIL